MKIRAAFEEQDPHALRNLYSYLLETKPTIRFAQQKDNTTVLTVHNVGNEAMLVVN